MNEMTERARRRLAARAARAVKVASIRKWHEDRLALAELRAVGRAAAESTRETGADRVPARLHFERTEFHPTLVPELGTYRGVSAPYRDRRAMGQRGHAPKTRRRDLPGAVARRVERNRLAWAEDAS